MKLFTYWLTLWSQALDLKPFKTLKPLILNPILIHPLRYQSCPISPGEDTWPGCRRVRIEGCVVINAGCLGHCHGGGKGCRAGPDGWRLNHKMIRHGPWICSTSTLTLITDRIPEMGLHIGPNRQHSHAHKKYICTDCLSGSVNFLELLENFLSISPPLSFLLLEWTYI